MKEMRFELRELSWERVFLNLAVWTNEEEACTFEFCRVRERQGEWTALDHSPMKILSREESGDEKLPFCYRFCINIAAFRGRSFADNGIWAIRAQTGGRESWCLAGHCLAYSFDDDSRVFRYGGGLYAYTVTFEVRSLDDRELLFTMNSRFMKENSGWKKRHYVEEARTLAGKIRRSYMVFAIFLIRLFYGFWSHVLPKKGDRVLLMSETHDYLWGNLKAIDSALKETGLDKKYRLSYSFRKAAGNHSDIGSWVRMIWLCAGADFIFVDDYVPFLGFLDLNPKTKLIQVWHAGEGFKAVGYCRFGKEGTPYPVGSCHKKYDYVLTGSEKLVKIFAEVFGIEEEAFLPLGMPRLDGFLDQDRIDTFRRDFSEKYPEFNGKKLVLFAPTYRGKGQKDAYYDYSWLDFEKLWQVLGEDRVLLMKMHPFVREKAVIPEQFRDRIVEFSDYPNINDLYYVTDLLVTDYSSNYFEYSLMKKPCLFYTPDREIYELAHGVHRPIKGSAPGKVCDTFEEMVLALEKEDYEEERVDKFVRENFSDYDGKASRRAIQAILGENV